MHMRQDVDIMDLSFNMDDRKRRQWVVGRVTSLPAIGPMRTKKWSCRRSAFSVLTTEKGYKLMYFLAAWKMLGKEVGRVYLAADFLDLNGAGPDLLLEP